MRRISASAWRPVRSAERSVSRAVSGSESRMPRAADLHDHHADAVGDDVVQLAGDTDTLLGGRHAHLLLALALERGGARLELALTRAVLAKRVAERPRDEQQGIQGRVIERLVIAGDRVGDVGGDKHDQYQAQGTQPAAQLGVRADRVPDHQHHDEGLEGQLAAAAQPWPLHRCADQRTHEHRDGVPAPPAQGDDHE
jgi:hypothetical protein